MSKIKIKGGQPLWGEVKIGGAKNSTVALIPASILADTPVEFSNVPNILDVHNLMVILESMNVKTSFKNDHLMVDSTHIKEGRLPSKAIKSLRASYYFMGALLGKFGYAEVSFPGGDDIGPRPIDQHLQAFKSLGAKVSEHNGTVTLDAKSGLKGTTINLQMVSVGATINTILAAVKAEGTTVLHNAAQEPEIIDLANFLNDMGAKITGAGTNTVTIKGVKKLKSVNAHMIIPDRIEAGTYFVLAAALGKGVLIKGIVPEHLNSFLDKLKEIGISWSTTKDGIYIPQPNKLKNVNIVTAPFPGFATDLQQPILPLLLKANGESKIKDTIYPKRVKHIPQLNKMGARVTVKNNEIIVLPSHHLHGATVKADEIRAGASLLITGLMASGETTILQADNILRGYDNIIDKLTKLHAEVEIIN